MSFSLSLEEAEKVERTNNSLSWDGWTLVHSKPHAMAMYRADGIRKNGRWFTVKRYEPQGDGRYHVPKAFGHGL